MKKLFLGFLFLLVLTLLPLPKANAAGPRCDSIELLGGNPPGQNTCPVCPPNHYWLNGGLNGPGCYPKDSSSYTMYCTAIIDCSRIPGTQCALGQNGFSTNLTGCCDPNDKNNPAKCYTSYPTPTPTPGSPTPTPGPGVSPSPSPIAGNSVRCSVCPTGANWNGSVCVDHSGNSVQLQSATCPGNSCDPNHSGAGCTLGDPQCGQFVLSTDTCPTSCPKTEVSSGVYKCLDPLNAQCDPYEQPSTKCSSNQVCFLTDPGKGTWSCCDPKAAGSKCSDQQWVGKDLCTKDGTTYKCSTGLGISLSTSPGGFVGQIFGIVLGIAGTIALILIIISGYKLMTSQGDAEKVKDAREQLTAAIIGLLFVIFSFFLLTFIGGTILGIYK